METNERIKKALEWLTNDRSRANMKDQKIQGTEPEQKKEPGKEKPCEK